jgi:hypothetical protein
LRDKIEAMIVGLFKIVAILYGVSFVLYALGGLASALLDVRSNRSLARSHDEAVRARVQKSLRSRLVSFETHPNPK